MEVTITKISDHLKGKSAKDGVSMYTVVTGAGSKKNSRTVHMNKKEIEQLKSSLKG